MFVFNFVDHLFSFIYCIYFKIFKKYNVIGAKFSFFNVLISNSMGNKVEFSSILLRKFRLKFDGTGNRVFLRGQIRNCNFLISGSGNSIVFEDDVLINNTNIVLRGNNCRIEIRRGATVGGACMVCMGIDNYIVIGSGAMLADEVEVWSTDSHPIFDVFDFSKPVNPSKGITIEDFVWIGKRANILKGVTIGHQSIVGMSSVVTRDVPCNSVVCGNPAKVVKTNVSWCRDFIRI